MQRKKQDKVEKGFLVVWVGCEHEDDEMRRFTIPISYLYHPQFRMLLENAREVYGFRLPGPLKLPCSVDDFLHLQWLAGKKPQKRTIMSATNTLLIPFPSGHADN